MTLFYINCYVFLLSIVLLLNVFGPNFKLTVFLNILTGSSAQSNDWCCKRRQRYRNCQARNNWERPTSFVKRKLDKQLFFYLFVSIAIVIFDIKS